MSDKQLKLIEVRYILSDALEEIKLIDHPFAESLMQKHIQIIDDLIVSGGDDYLDDLASNFDALLTPKADGELQ